MSIGSDRVPASIRILHAVDSLPLPMRGGSGSGELPVTVHGPQRKVRASAMEDFSHCAGWGLPSTASDRHMLAARLTMSEPPRLVELNPDHDPKSWPHSAGGSQTKQLLTQPEAFPLPKSFAPSDRFLTPYFASFLTDVEPSPPVDPPKVSGKGAR